MVVPVAKQLATEDSVDIQVLGLTTAANVVKTAQLSLLQFSDFLDLSVDQDAISVGHRLAASSTNAEVTSGESAAYLGLSYCDLVGRVGAEEAENLYSRLGRQAFLPISVLKRVIDRVSPDLVVITNSPRAERAAAICAKARGIPVVCIVDLFATDEVQWLATNDYADAFCVLNEYVKEFLINSGCPRERVHVTGNPAFDRLQAPHLRSDGLKLRQRVGWDNKQVLLWPCVDEPSLNPFDGLKGDTSAPTRALCEIVAFCLSQRDVILCVRPRPGYPVPNLPMDPRIFVTGFEWDLAELLHAVDLAIVMNSTVALEAHLAGVRVIKVLGSVYDRSMPLVEHGIADCETPISNIQSELATRVGLSKLPVPMFSAGTNKVLEVIKQFL